MDGIRTDTTTRAARRAKFRLTQPSHLNFAPIARFMDAAGYQFFGLQLHDCITDGPKARAARRA
jgi:hypothetical protein